MEGERQRRDDRGVCIDLVVPFEGSAVSEFLSINTHTHTFCNAVIKKLVQKF